MGNILNLKLCTDMNCQEYMHCDLDGWSHNTEKPPQTGTTGTRLEGTEMTTGT